MQESRRVISTKVKQFREDYIRARARVLLLKGQAVTEDQLSEIVQLEQFIAAVDAMVEVFPEAQRKIIRLSILDDLPVTKVAIDVGYHYTWVLELRDRAVKTIEQVLNGDIILSELGLNLKGAIHDSIT
jgi:hypothetical protein|nr:MAG TPA: Protein of unknown function (DUF722) [Caudoviricetes sp.]